ncbi:MAG TPA: protein rep, partial [Paludibacter sp.]|nr:protein rep [Paludibacter sp.]
MEKKNPQPSQKAIYTLAQSETGRSERATEIPIRILLGKGTDLADKRALSNRAKRKLTAQALCVRLVSEVEKMGDKELERTFWNIFHCQRKLVKHKGRTYGKYCKNRFCPLCASIRKAEIINRYLPVIETWEDPHFVTLTQKSVPANKLEQWFFGVNKAFRQIKNKYRKQNQRGGDIQFMGIKCLECNFNPKRRTYNPHLHLIVPNKAMADLLIREWQKKWTEKFTSPLAQHQRRVGNLRRDLVETIKYGSKIFTDFDAKNKGKMPPKIYIAAMINIYKAMKPYHLFDSFGFNLPKEEKICTKTTISSEECKDFIYAPEVY